jgi:hypothetical protein
MITDPLMVKRMAKALDMAGNVYTLTDIMGQIEKGTLQSHVENDTWAVTQVQNFPRKKVVDILYVVGYLDDSLRMEKKLEHWAGELGADMLTAAGREGWWNFRTPGWKQTGTMYAKELKNG